MWSVLYLVCLAIAFYHSFFWSSLHLYVLSTLVYVLFYAGTRGHLTGTRNWTWLRSLPMWDSLRIWYFPHRLHSMHWSKFDVELKGARRRAFIFLAASLDADADTTTTTATTERIELVDDVLGTSAFALHGCKNPAISRLSPLVAVHRWYFYLPYITDVMQWCGFIAQTESAIEAALIRNVSVVTTRLDVATVSNNADLSHVSIVPVVHYMSRGPLYTHPFPLSRRREGFIPRDCALGYWGSFLPKRAMIDTYIGDPIPIGECGGGGGTDNNRLSAGFNVLYAAVTTSSAQNDAYDFEIV